MDALAEKIDEATGVAGSGQTHLTEVAEMISKAGKEGSAAVDDVFGDTLQVLAAGREVNIGSQNFQVVFKQGQPTLYEILDKSLLETLQLHGVRDFKGLSKLAEKTSFATKLFSSLITHNPAFIAVNFLRDTNSATFNSVHGFIPIWSSVKGFAKAVRNNEAYREFIMAGGGSTTRLKTQGFGEQKTFLNLGSEIRESALKRFWSKGKGSYENFVQLTETAARFAEYNMAIKSGSSTTAAAYLAREVSTNFSQRGSSLILNNYAANTAFFNAGLQGIYRAGRRVGENPKKVALIATAQLGLPAYGLWSMNSQYEEYERESNHVKDLNYLIPNFKNFSSQETLNALTEWAFGDGPPPALDEDVPFIYIPKPYDFGQIATFIEGTLETLKKGRSNELINAFGRSITNVLPGTHLPTLIQPVGDLLTNRNFFGAHIVPPYHLSTRLPEDAVLPSTGDLAKWVSSTVSSVEQLFGKSRQQADFLTPIEAEYLIDFYTPGLLDLAETWVGSTLRDTQKGAAPEGLKGRDRISQNPLMNLITVGTSSVTRRFMSSNPTPGNALTEQLWDLKERADRVIGSDRFSEKNFFNVTGLKKNWEKNSEEHQLLRAMSPTLAAAAEHYREFQLQIQIYRDHPDLDSKQKQERIVRLRRMQSTLIEQTVRGLQNMRGSEVLHKNFFSRVFDSVGDSFEEGTLDNELGILGLSKE
jgi:hypothetical protein